jgi:hypothetical protein
MDKSTTQLIDSIDLPSLDLAHESVYVDIGWLANADHRTAFRLIFERLLETNRELLEPMRVIAVAANRPLNSQSSALSQLPAEMIDVFADAARVANVLYDSHNTEVVLVLATGSQPAQLHVSFDNPGFRLSRDATAA